MGAAIIYALVNYFLIGPAIGGICWVLGCDLWYPDGIWNDLPKHGTHVCSFLHPIKQKYMGVSHGFHDLCP